MSTTNTGGYSWWQQGFLDAIDGYFDKEAVKNRPTTHVPTDPDPQNNPALTDGDGSLIGSLADNSKMILFASIGLLGVALVLKGLK